MPSAGRDLLSSLACGMERLDMQIYGRPTPKIALAEQFASRGRPTCVITTSNHIHAPMVRRERIIPTVNPTVRRRSMTYWALQHKSAINYSRRFNPRHEHFEHTKLLRGEVVPKDLLSKT